jgi:nucleotide-binding universal stress UspA family protein
VPVREDAVVRTGPLGRIVCATDFSEASRHAVEYAKDFAAAGTSPLTLMTVIDWPFGDSSGPDPVTRLRESLEQEATDSLATLGGAPTDHHIDVAVGARRTRPGVARVDGPSGAARCVVSGPDGPHAGTGLTASGSAQ